MDTDSDETTHISALAAEQLLLGEDGPPHAGARRHVATCLPCRAYLARLSRSAPAIRDRYRGVVPRARAAMSAKVVVARPAWGQRALLRGAVVALVAAIVALVLFPRTPERADSDRDIIVAKGTFSL